MGQEKEIEVGWLGWAKIERKKGDEPDWAGKLRKKCLGSVQRKEMGFGPRKFRGNLN